MNNSASEIAFSLGSEKQYQIADTLLADKPRSQITQSDFEKKKLNTNQLRAKMRQPLEINNINLIETATALTNCRQTRSNSRRNKEKATTD
ncbi:hypothetical protein [Vibrio metschnikovii]|uniref:hypothetical protein n=1 Tax=Vibrio metschnikovii TaxID=28172 RepID=UPI001C30CE92|nr:hypothetical protein [Vibrio metschnikovii]